MVIYILLIFWLFLSFLCPKDKKMFAVLLIFMIIIMGFNTDNADYSNYKTVYNYLDSYKSALNSSETHIESGISILFYFLKRTFGLEYEYALRTIAVIALLFLANTVLKYCYYPTLVLALYFLAPFFPCDIIQIRNFLAEIIIVKAVLELFNSKDCKKKDIIKYFLMIILACIFHTSAIFYLLLVLVVLIKDKKIFNITILILSLSALLLPNVIFLFPFIPSYKIDSYLSNAAIRSNIRDMILLFVMLIQLFSCRYMESKIISLKDANAINSESVKLFAERCYKGHLIFLISMVLIIFYSSAYYRMPRNFLLVDYVFLDKYLFLYGRRDRKPNLFLLLYICLALLWSSVSVFSQWNIILQNNSILKFFW